MKILQNMINPLYAKLVTCNDILLQSLVVGGAPLAKSVESHIIGLKLTVRIGEKSPQIGNDLWRPPVKWTQEHTPGVVVVSVDVVPNDWWALDDRRHFL